MTSLRPSPHAREITLLRTTQGHSGRLPQSRTGGDTHPQTHKEMGIHCKRTHTDTQHWRTYLHRDTGGDPLRGERSRHTHEETTERLMPTHTYTHHGDSHRHWQTCRFTPLDAFKSRFLAEKEATSPRAGGHCDPQLRNFPRPRARC